MAPIFFARISYTPSNDGAEAPKRKGILQMKKLVLITIVSILVVLGTVAGVSYAESKIIENKRRARVEEALERVAQETGYESLGIVDAYQVSQDAGYAYSGQAVMKALFERRGEEPPTNYWTFLVDVDFGKTTIRKMVVYKGEVTEPIFEQEVDKIYLYGTI